MELLGKSKTFFLTVITILALSAFAAKSSVGLLMFGWNTLISWFLHF